MIIINVINFVKNVKILLKKGINFKICGRVKNNIKKVIKFVIIVILFFCILYVFGISLILLIF